MPILLYAAEAVNWTNRMTASIENSYSRVYVKVFKTYNKEIISSCQYHMGKLTMNMEIGVRRLNFLSKLQTCKSNSIHQIFNIKEELFNVAKRFNIVVNARSNHWHSLMWQKFTNEQENKTA